MTEQAHAEFETWWNRQPHREQFEDVKDQMRNVWRASRAEMVIRLPDAYANCPPHACYEGGWNDMRDEAVDAIEAAGAKWRE